MLKIDIDVNDGGLTARLANAQTGFSRALGSTVEMLAIDGEGFVVSHTPVGATGHLRQGMTHEVSNSGVMVEGRIFSTDVPIKVASVESGRAPGRMPPIAPIQLWVSRKLGADDVEAVAFLVARAIARRGTKGAGMFEKGFGDLQKTVASRLASLRDEIGRLL